MKRIEVGWFDGKPVFADRLVCASCAATIESGQRGCMMVLLVLAGVIGIFWLGLFLYDFFFGDPLAFKPGW